MNVLNITDGTTTINLLNLEDGFSVDDWRQQVAQYKGGGTWLQSALTDGSRLVAKSFDNVVEEIPMPGIKGVEPDITAAIVASLLMLLEKTSDYWRDDWRNEPVWLESQNDGETYRQYAILYAGGFPDLGDPYSFEYVRNAVITGLVLRVVRDHWADNPPKVGTALPISAVETWDARNFGNVDDAGARDVTTAAEVYCVNKRVEANITHAYHVDVSAGPTLWVDLITAGPPVALFPPVPAVGDFLVFGIECAGPPHYLFSNAIFDIGTTNVNIETIWEYWPGGAMGAAWNALSPFDNTDNAPAVALDVFEVGGVNGVWWDQPSDWAIGNLNAIFPAAAPNVNGYWVRCRVTGLGGATTVPTQQNRDIYTCTWPYIEVQAADIGGHIDAILKLQIETRSDNRATDGRITNRIIGGLRSVDRGSEFASFLNLGNVQNPTGVSINIADGVRSSFQSNTSYPAYYYVRYAPGADNTILPQVDVYLEHVIIGAGHFYGTFRVFLRCEQVGGVAGDIGVQLSRHFYFPIVTEQLYTPIVGSRFLFDFGELTIPHVEPMELLDTTWVGISCSNTNAPAADLYMYELILMPIDEFAFDVTVESATGRTQTATSQGFRLNIDSITDPKRLVRTTLENPTFSQIITQWQTIASDRLRFHPNKRQRFWFLHEKYYTTGNVPQFYIGSRSQMLATQRYLGRRGAG